MSRTNWLLKGDPMFQMMSTRVIDIPVRIMPKLIPQPILISGSTNFGPFPREDPYPLAFTDAEKRKANKRIRPPIIP